jgi:hypothetical protein
MLQMRCKAASVAKDKYRERAKALLRYQGVVIGTFIMGGCVVYALAGFMQGYWLLFCLVWEEGA